MKADALRERLLAVLRGVVRRRRSASSRGIDLDLAVARGAAYYGLVRRGRGIRIRGGAARAYYVGVETAMPAVPGMPPPLKALCVVPLGMEEGSELELPGQEFGLVVGEPAEFRFLGSSSREDDALGTVARDSGRRGRGARARRHHASSGRGHDGTLVPVRLRVHVTEVGTLELWCVARDGKRRWKLEFGVRHAEPRSLRERG